MKLNQLAKRIQKGDRTAYREVAEQFGKMVFYTAQAELDDRDRAMEVSRRVLGSLFELLRKGEVPDDPTKYLQRAVRYECRNLDAEEGVMADLLADIQADSDVDMIFGDLAKPATGVSPAAATVSLPTVSAAPVQPAADPTVSLPAQHAAAPVAAQPAPAVTPAAVIAAQVPPIEGATQTMPVPTGSPEPTAQMPAVAGDQSEPLFDGQPASKDSELYQQFYGQAESLGKRKGHVGMFFGILFTIILVAVLAWLVCGILMRMGVVTGVPDLGYTWFNQSVFPLF